MSTPPQPSSNWPDIPPLPNHLSDSTAVLEWIQTTGTVFVAGQEKLLTAETEMTADDKGKLTVRLQDIKVQLDLLKAFHENLLAGEAIFKAIMDHKEVMMKRDL